MAGPEVALITPEEEELIEYLTKDGAMIRHNRTGDLYWQIDGRLYRCITPNPKTSAQPFDPEEVAAGGSQ